MLYGTDIAVQSVFGGQLQHCLRFMTDEILYLTQELDETIAQRKKDLMLLQRSPFIILEESQINHEETGGGDDVDNKNEKDSNDSKIRIKDGEEIIKNKEEKEMPMHFMSEYQDQNFDRISHSSALRRGSIRVFKRPKSDMDCGNQFTIDELILSYRQLGLYAEQMNERCSYNFLTMHVIAYIQMTCDVFVIFQLLRTPGSEPSDVAYFIEDCIVSF
jgi:hypothetical protein